MGKHNYKPWNLGHLLPKRDFGCRDLEDWRAHELRKGLVNKPKYHRVSEDMIVDETYLLEDKDITFIEIPPLPLWHTIPLEELYNLGSVHKYPCIDSYEMGLEEMEQFLSDLKQDPEMGRWKEELEEMIWDSIEEARYQDARTELFNRILNRS